MGLSPFPPQFGRLAVRVLLAAPLVLAVMAAVAIR